MSSAPSRSSSDIEAALTLAAEQVRADIRALRTPFPVVLIDGRSGAGKTSLAAALAAEWPVTCPVDVVALDDIYPGWDGMDAAVEQVLGDILVPRTRGEAGRWRQWDWERGCSAQSHVVPIDRALVIEGSGILTADTAAVADLTVWVQAPDLSRHDRALARDGDTYRPHWERWARQEERHLLRDDPVARAARVVTLP